MMLSFRSSKVTALSLIQYNTDSHALHSVIDVKQCISNELSPQRGHDQ